MQDRSVPSVENADDVRAYRHSIGLAMPIVLDDGRLGAAFNLRVTPQHVLSAAMDGFCMATARPQTAASRRAVRQQAEAVAGNPGVRWLGVASGLWATREDLDSYRVAHRMTIPLTLDESGELFRATSRGPDTRTGVAPKPRPLNGGTGKITQ